MYKVFFNDSYFLLCDKPNFIKDKPNVFIYKNIIQLQNHVMDCLNSDVLFQSIIYAPKIDLLLRNFTALFRFINAAGGAVVVREELLLIKRLGVYDLPKGQIEPKETTEACAIREVTEETGVQNLRITKILDTTWHIYIRDNHWFLKQTHWFKMTATNQQQLVPQQEENIEEVFWCPIHDVPQYIPKMHHSLRSLIEEIVEFY